ncbi:hypothetical protein DRP05_11705 [Archaeoglobales archaeon]|nr:MAG: hypothetical protein DRP05_11705 [Archaeoglobales archaeon]
MILLGLFKRGNTEKCILVGSDPHLWEIKKLKRVGKVLFDYWSGKAYSSNLRKITIKNGRKIEEYNLIDAETGCFLELEKDKGDKKDKDKDVKIVKDDIVYKLKTFPEIHYQIIDGGIANKLAQLSIPTGKLVAAWIVGVGIGFFVGLLF